MTLRNLSLKQEYRIDRDDLISEFFVPCLSNCIQFDRAIQYVTAKSIGTLWTGFRDLANNSAKLRIIAGHRFKPEDLTILSKSFHEENKEKNTTEHVIVDGNTIGILRKIIHNNNLEIKIAIPDTGFCSTFSENIGIFKDSEGNRVAFSGTSNMTFSDQNKSFESIDVFTSWDDGLRVERKIENFEALWENKTRHLKVYDFSYADKNHLLQYSI